MTKDHSSSAEKETAAIRRRWVTLAEFLGAAGVIISALALWNSYQERSSDEAEKAAAKDEATARAQTVVLRGTPEDGGARLSLAPADTAQTLQVLTIAFPAALSIAPIEAVADPRIEARWFDRQILRETAADEGQGQNSRAERRLPIAIATRHYNGGAVFYDAAVYTLVYRVEGGGLFEGREIRLQGLSRLTLADVDNLVGARTAVDRLWTARQRPPGSTN